MLESLTTPRIAREHPAQRSGGRHMTSAEDRLGFLLQFCQALEGAASLDASLDVLEETVNKLGWRKLVYGWKLPESDEHRPSVPVLTRNFPSDWDRDWTTHSPHDPYFGSAYATRSPVSWSEVKASRDLLRPRQVDCMDYIDDLCLGEGFTIPVCVPGRRFAFVTALDPKGPTQGEADPRDGVELIKLIAHFFDNHVIAAAAGMRQNCVVLSARERECLLWSAKGKTVEDIGAIIGISVETVRVYMKRVIAKLDAANKTHAVAKAIHLGLVTIN